MEFVFPLLVSLMDEEMKPASYQEEKEEETRNRHIECSIRRTAYDSYLGLVRTMRTTLKQASSDRDRHCEVSGTVYVNAKQPKQIRCVKSDG